MALENKVGSFALNTSTGNQSISGLGFQPKAVIFMWSRQTGDGSGAGVATGKGFAVSSTQRCAVYINSKDNVATTDSDRRMTASACISVIDSTDTLLEEADLVSMDADGFTINVTTAGAGIIVGFLALGGTDITNVAIKQFTSAVATGNQSITGIGFQPSMLMAMTDISSNSPPQSETGGFFNFGIGVGTNNATISATNQNNGTPISEKSSQRTDALFDLTTSTTTFFRASMVSMDADGFTINWSAVNATARTIFALCIKGGNFKVGSFNQPTSTGNQAITGVGFLPGSLLLASFNKAATVSYASDAKASYGLASSPSQALSLFHGSSNTSGNSIESSDLDRTKLLKLMTQAGATPTVNASATLVSFGSDGFTLNWGVADSTARQVLYLAMGSTTASASPSSSVSSSPSPSSSVSLSPSLSPSASISSSPSASGSPSSSVSSSPSSSQSPSASQSPSSSPSLSPSSSQSPSSSISPSPSASASSSVSLSPSVSVSSSPSVSVSASQSPSPSGSLSPSSSISSSVSPSPSPLGYTFFVDQVKINFQVGYDDKYPLKSGTSFTSPSSSQSPSSSPSPSAGAAAGTLLLQSGGHMLQQDGTRIDI